MASSMATISSSSISLSRPLQAITAPTHFLLIGIESLASVQFHFLSAPEASRLLDCDRVLPVSGSLVRAKPETVTKVCDIVRKQLALPPDSAVTGESKFAAVGADSLDTVEIVMGLEEEFGISVEEETAQAIATVQDAADLIEKVMKVAGGN